MQDETQNFGETAESKLIYVAKRSVWYYSRWMLLGVVFFVLGITFIIVGATAKDFIAGIIIGVILMIAAVIVCALCVFAASRFKLSIYTDKIIQRSGIINIRESNARMTMVIGVSYEQSLWGRLFNYGTVIVDKVGRVRWDINSSYVKNPKEMKRVMEELISDKDYKNVNQIIVD